MGEEEEQEEQEEGEEEGMQCSVVWCVCVGVSVIYSEDLTSEADKLEKEIKEEKASKEDKEAKKNQAKAR